MPPLDKSLSKPRATIARALARMRQREAAAPPMGRKRLAPAQPPQVLRRIAFISPAHPSPVYGRLLYAIQEAAGKRQWSVDIISYSSLSGFDFPRVLDGYDAALFVPWSGPIPDQVKKSIKLSEKPIICLREYSPRGSCVRSILLDDYEIGRLATSHLIQLGHRHIVAMTSEPYSPLASRRLAAWRDVMEEGSLGDTDLLVADCSVKAGVNSTLGSYYKFKQWLNHPARPDFTAIFCLDWTGALAAMRALRESGLAVPRDVSLVTYSSEEDWSAFLFLNPAVTTVEINLAEFAAESLEQVENALAGKAGGDAPIKLRPFLMVRESTAQPAAGRK